MQHNEFYFYCHNKKLYGQYWKPQQLKAVVVLVHGMGSHSGRYSSFVVPEFIDKGYAVIGFDHFGHGHTEGKRGTCPGYEAVLDSITEVFDKVDELFNGFPRFLYGHSMGGNVALNYVLRRKPELKGVVITSPFLRIAFPTPAWKMALGKLFYRIAPNITLSSGIDAKYISRDEKEVNKYKEDKLVHNRISPNFSIPFIKAGEEAISKALQLHLPLLLLHGTDDYITSHYASKAFAKQSEKYTELKLFEGGYHELHNDLEKQEVLNTITGWMDNQL
ncbi:alpha/beta hydrolase [Zhouia spongiae]|uniref:Alpha/beta hydrolase n=1 Tax=Zhouia spongiae TaxID=2202721 RepID=A0ABY3YLW7_9FLAO|nr:alpha/beta hydrolase [Zhouia spongiae]UNY98481.1 alpha/beta hydrolase [Zhouia spongiae]